MRENATKAEKALRRLLPSDWEQQVPLCGDYIADFYHPLYRVVIEADGGYHNNYEQVAKDHERDARMAADGVLVIRFTNTQIRKQPKWVAETIDRQVRNLCRVSRLPLPEKTKELVGRLARQTKGIRRRRCLNGRKAAYHVIPDRSAIED